jgi:hypothetical protein
MIYALLHILLGVGVLQFVGASERGTVIAQIGAWMIIGVGMATIGTAVFPQDAAGTPATTPGQIHKLLVFAGLLPFSFLSTLLIGIWFKRAGMFPGFATYSLISVCAIVLIGGAGSALVETPYAGLGERISALVIHQWLFFLALKLFLQ